MNQGMIVDGHASQPLMWEPHTRAADGSASPGGEHPRNHWPTPRAVDGDRMETSVAIPLGVHVAVQELRASRSRRRTSGGKDNSLDEEDPAYTSNTLLRPAFVEWLMGLPEGWTDVNRCDAKDFEPHDGWKEWLNPPPEGCPWEQPGATVEIDAPQQHERCRALGNALVPIAAWEAFRTLAGFSPRKRRVAPPTPPITRRLNPEVTVEVPFPDPDLAEALRSGTSRAANEPEPEPGLASKRKFVSITGDQIRPQMSGDGATHTRGRWKHVTPRKYDLGEVQTAAATAIPPAPVYRDIDTYTGFCTPLQIYRYRAGVADGAAELMRQFTQARRDAELKHANEMLRVQEEILRENTAFGVDDKKDDK